jgi:hypothetical protein
MFANIIAQYTPLIGVRARKRLTASRETTIFESNDRSFKHHYP